MTKTQLLGQFAKDPDRRLLFARLLDKRSLCEERDVPVYSGFLSPEEQTQAEDLLRKLPPVVTLLHGGYEDAERRICAFLPSWMDASLWTMAENCPLCALEVNVPSFASLSHRDYLGALMGLGITREKIGDILVREGGCQVLLLGEVKSILLDQWDKVGRYPVTLRELPLEEVASAEVQVKQIRDTVQSLRLDAVSAAGFGISRSRAADLIAAGKVMVNHRISEKADKLVAPGDVLSCRGLGKCVLLQAEGKSKKGRTILEMERYI